MMAVLGIWRTSCVTRPRYSPRVPSSRATSTSVCQNRRYLSPSCRSRVRATSERKNFPVETNVFNAPVFCGPAKTFLVPESTQRTILLSNLDKHKATFQRFKLCGPHVATFCKYGNCCRRAKFGLYHLQENMTETKQHETTVDFQISAAYIVISHEQSGFLLFAGRQTRRNEMARHPKPGDIGS